MPFEVRRAQDQGPAAVGMEVHQQDNLLETLMNINSRERVKILIGFVQFVAMVLNNVATVALQAEQLLKEGTVEEVAADEGVSFVQRPMLPKLLRASGSWRTR